MAKMLPHRCDASTTESAAERALFERFRDEPGTEQWTVLHSLGLARRGRKPYGEIDFVVLIPSAGVFCLEVKGGGVTRHDGVWTTTGRHGTSELKRSPFLQAVHCEGDTDLIGQIIPVRIDASAKMSLSGTLANATLLEPA